MLKSPAKWWDISVVCLVISVFLWMFSKSTADPDLWGHVKFGEDLWITGQIVRSDPYSYLTGARLWINHEWLTEALFYLVFSIAGPSGLIFLNTAINLLVIGLLYWHLCHQGLSSIRAGILLLLVAPLLIPWVASIRPQGMTNLLFVALLLLIHQIDRGRIQWLWAVPLVFALWVNLHGGFLAGMGIFLLWWLCHLAFSITRRGGSERVFSRTHRFIFLSIMASLLALLLNPYGMTLLTFLWHTAIGPRPEISEWRPMPVLSLMGGLYLTLLVIVSAGIAYSRRDRSPALIVLCACSALLPLIAFRHMPFFVFTVVAFAGEHIADAWDRWSTRHEPTGATNVFSRFRPWLVGCHFAGAIALTGLSLSHFKCIRIIEPVPYPVRAVALLKASGAGGNLAVHFDWGEYALWHLAPKFKVSVDGRRETVYSDKIYLENFNFTFGTKDWNALLVNHETQLALVSKEYPVFNLMSLTPDWNLVYEDPLSGLFVRRGTQELARIQGTIPPQLPYNGAGLCFP